MFLQCILIIIWCFFGVTSLVFLGLLFVGGAFGGFRWEEFGFRALSTLNTFASWMAFLPLGVKGLKMSGMFIQVFWLKCLHEKSWEAVKK